MRFLLTCTLLLAISFTSSAQLFYLNTPESKHWVDSVFNSLSQDEKIAQLMVLRESAITPDGVKFYDEDIEKYIKKYNIGAICLFQGSPVTQAKYINHFQGIASTPLMVCIDGEMGLGMRMTDSVLKFPDQLTIGAISDTNIVLRIGRAIGAQCKRMGINVDYAPVVDINNNPNNPVIGYRSFGQDKYKVATFGVQIAKGIQANSVMACAKHFPGHGDVSVDSHFDLPVINKSLADLDSLELYPFKKLFEANVGSVMIAHLSVPAIDSTPNQPTSLSPKNINGLLRTQLDYKGISFTDALEMKGVAKYYPAGEASVQSLIAGNDMLCLPGDIEGSIKKIRRALKDGDLDWADINEKVRKVLLAKYNMGLWNFTPVDTTNLVNDLNKNVIKLRSDVAENALTLLRFTDSTLLPLKQQRVAYLGVGIDTLNEFAKQLVKNFGAQPYYLSYKSNEATANNLLSQLRNNYDAVVIGVHKYSKYPSNNFGLGSAAINLIKQLQQATPAITFLFGNPYAAKNFCDAPNLVVAYEDDSVFHTAAIHLLQGEITAKGTLPVTVCDDFSFGSGIVLNDPYNVVKPETVGLNSDTLNIIDSIANAAIAQHAAPGCVVLVARNGKIAFYRSYGFMNYDSIQPVKKSTVYDLASVTKISATTMSVMKLYEEGKLDITKTLGDYLPWVRGTNKQNLRLNEVLMHEAGLVAWIPFYKETIDLITGRPKPGIYASIPDSNFSVRVADNMYERKDWIDTIYNRILTSPLGAPRKYVYSDLDFIFLGKIVEQLTHKTLDEYASENFYVPLHMTTTSFKPRLHEPLDMIAPTEKEKVFRLQLLRGDVHDPGAAMLGGVAGHAGLFSNAYDLAQLYIMLLNGGTRHGVHYFKKETIDYFTAYHSATSRRGYGFDKPEKDNATRPDPYPTLSASPETFGHTGFTGTCVWADPKNNLLFIFLSNRVCPDGGENLKLSQLNVRGSIQETIYKALIKPQTLLNAAK